MTHIRHLYVLHKITLSLCYQSESDRVYAGVQFRSLGKFSEETAEDVCHNVRTTRSNFRIEYVPLCIG